MIFLWGDICMFSSVASRVTTFQIHSSHAYEHRKTQIFNRRPLKDSVSVAGGQLNKLTLPVHAVLLVLRQMDGDTNTEGSSPLPELAPGFPNAVWKETDILTTMEKWLYRNKSTSNKNQQQTEHARVEGRSGERELKSIPVVPQVHAQVDRQFCTLCCFWSEMTGMSESTGLQLKTGLCSPHPNASDVPSRSYRPLSKIPQSTNHDSMNGSAIKEVEHRIRWQHGGVFWNYECRVTIASHEGRPHTLIFHSLETFRSSKSRDCRVHQMESQNLTRKEVEEERKSCLQ